MRKAVLFIAMSLDGFIADSEGKVGWLEGHGKEEEMIDAWSEFVTQVDTVVMGWNTYHQIVTELSPDEWIYGGLESYVITHGNCQPTEKIHFYNGDPCSLVKMLKDEDGKDLWICGGAELVQQLMREELIDQYDISVIPTLLGRGIRLFGDMDKELPLKLVRTRSYNGITELVYERRESL